MNDRDEMGNNIDETGVNKLEGFRVGQFIDVPGLSVPWVISNIDPKTRIVTLANADPKSSESKLTLHKASLDDIKLWLKHSGRLPQENE